MGLLINVKWLPGCRIVKQLAGPGGPVRNAWRLGRGELAVVQMNGRRRMGASTSRVLGALCLQKDHVKGVAIGQQSDFSARRSCRCRCLQATLSVRVLLNDQIGPNPKPAGQKWRETGKGPSPGGSEFRSRDNLSLWLQLHDSGKILPLIAANGTSLGLGLVTKMCNLAAWVSLG